jgi:hypothetical protein
LDASTGSADARADIRVSSDAPAADAGSDADSTDGDERDAFDDVGEDVDDGARDGTLDDGPIDHASHDGPTDHASHDSSTDHASHDSSTDIDLPDAPLEGAAQP